jgi:uncharacterized membrane protein YgcG
MLATNFGLVFTEDGGQTWSWSCERDDNAYGIFYQPGPAPRHRLFAVANAHVIYSDDGTCTWRVAGGLLATQSVTDVFPDPANADRVVAIGIATGTSHAVFESADGGATFGSVLYQASAGDALNGVEIARSDPRVVYVAVTSQGGSPRLARTGDAGAQWTVGDLSTGLGLGSVRIIAVDPNDANTVLLRWTGIDGTDAIGVTRDGGATVAKTLSIPSSFTAFARMPDGALVLGGKAFVGQQLIPALFVSHDGGMTFAENDAVPGIVALAQRGGILYAAADNFVDGFALGASSDEGATWQPVLRFDQVGSIAACLRTNPQCQASCEALAGKGLGSPGKIWEEAVCAGSGGSQGAGGAAGGAGAGSGAAGGGGGTGGGGGSSGCGCALGHGVDFALEGAIAGAALLAIALLRATRGRKEKRRQ